MHSELLHASSTFIPVSACPPHQPLFRSAGLEIRCVTQLDERLETDRLVRRMYAWRGYRASDMAGEKLGSRRFTFAAWQDSELAATVTLNLDSGFGLLSESLYPQEIAALRRKGARICEYSRLASDPAYSSPWLFDTFFRIAYNFARSRLHCSDAVVEINPRHARYYERELGFTLLGPRRICPRVDAPAMLLHRDLRHPLAEAIQAA